MVTVPNRDDKENPVGLTYQAKFTESGKITAVPAKNTERPQREKQGNLLQWHEEQEKLKAWQEVDENLAKRD